MVQVRAIATMADQYKVVSLGSALVLYCCKAHAKINRKIENSTTCKIVTHENFNMKLGTCDYVGCITHWVESVQRGFHQIREYNIFVTSLLSCLFFLVHARRAQVEPSH